MKVTRVTPLLLVAALMASCDDKSCHYQEGVDTLTISANPTSISAVNGTSIITAIGTGRDNLPMPDGTIVTFTADLGGFQEGSQAAMTGGVARITFLSTGLDGTANVFGRTGSTVSQTITIAIGTDAVGSISVSANPGQLIKNGGKVKITAIVYSKNNMPLQGIPVIFTADVGTLSSGGSQVLSDRDGIAKDTLTVGVNGTGDTRQITITARFGNTSDSTAIDQLGG